MYFSVYFRPENKNIKYRRQYIETDDGGVISLEWPFDGKSSELKTENTQFEKLIVILHGLTGDASDSYIKEIINQFIDQPDYKVVALQYRGVSNTPLATSISFHCGFTDDCNYAMKYLQQMYPDKRCYVIGCSMGANIFTLLFAKHPEFKDYVKGNLDFCNLGFVSVSNPLNCYEIEKRNRNGVIDTFLLSKQKKYLTKHIEILSQRQGKIINLTFNHFNRY